MSILVPIEVVPRINSLSTECIDIKNGYSELILYTFPNIASEIYQSGCGKINTYRDDCVKAINNEYIDFEVLQPIIMNYIYQSRYINDLISKNTNFTKYFTFQWFRCDLDSPKYFHEPKLDEICFLISLVIRSLYGLNKIRLHENEMNDKLRELQFSESIISYIHTVNNKDIVIFTSSLDIIWKLIQLYSEHIRIELGIINNMSHSNLTTLYTSMSKICHDILEHIRIESTNIFGTLSSFILTKKYLAECSAYYRLACSLDDEDIESAITCLNSAQKINQTAISSARTDAQSLLPYIRKVKKQIQIKLDEQKSQKVYRLGCGLSLRLSTINQTTLPYVEITHAPAPFDFDNNEMPRNLFACVREHHPIGHEYEREFKNKCNIIYNELLEKAKILTAQYCSSLASFNFDEIFEPTLDNIPQNLSTFDPETVSNLKVKCQELEDFVDKNEILFTTACDNPELNENDRKNAHVGAKNIEEAVRRLNLIKSHLRDFDELQKIRSQQFVNVATSNLIDKGDIKVVTVIRKLIEKGENMLNQRHNLLNKLQEKIKFHDCSTFSLKRNPSEMAENMFNNFEETKLLQINLEAQPKLINLFVDNNVLVVEVRESVQHDQSLRAATFTQLSSFVDMVFNFNHQLDDSISQLNRDYAILSRIPIFQPQNDLNLISNSMPVRMPVYALDGMPIEHAYSNHPNVLPPHGMPHRISNQIGIQPQMVFEHPRETTMSLVCSIQRKYHELGELINKLLNQCHIEPNDDTEMILSNYSPIYESTNVNEFSHQSNQYPPPSTIMFQMQPNSISTNINENKVNTATAYNNGNRQYSYRQPTNNVSTSDLNLTLPQLGPTTGRNPDTTPMNRNKK